jgi:hypothetical protein
VPWHDQKNIKDIGHEENIVKWSNERLEEVEWTTTSKAKEGSSGNKLQIWRRVRSGGETVFTYVTVCDDRPYKDKNDERRRRTLGILRGESGAHWPAPRFKILKSWEFWEFAVG